MTCPLKRSRFYKVSGVDGIGEARPSNLQPSRRAVKPGSGFAAELDSALGSKEKAPSLHAPLRGDIVKSFSEQHKGVDIAASVGSPVSSALPGVVESAGWAGDLGNLLVVRSGVARAYYGHLSQFDVTPGQQVDTGQRLALSGSTGATQQPSLHFALHLAGVAVDPAPSLVLS